MLEINNTTKNKLNLKKIELIVEAFLIKYHKKKYLVSLAVIGGKKMRALNRDYRSADRTTDVLSFAPDKNRPDKTLDLGEVVINFQESRKIYKYAAMFQELGLDIRNRKKINRFKTEEYIFYFLVVHGLLHLAGYNDEEEKDRREMVRRGYNFLNSF